VLRVRVTIKLKLRGRCRFVTRRGRYTRLRSCKRPKRITARGTKRWAKRVRVRRPSLRPGRYVVVARAVDRQGNRSERAVRAFRVG